MPTYKNPQTGDEADVPEGQAEFYASHGWVLVSNKPAETVTFDIGFDSGPQVVDFAEAVKKASKKAGL